MVPLWLAVVTGIARPDSYLEPVSWHAHEMLFGFTVAVIAGFLLTAVGNWTQRETLVGWPLLALAGVWLLGRVAMVFATTLPRGLTAALDLAFLPLLLLTLARPLIAAQNRRNLSILAILVAFFAANLAVHLEALGVLPGGWARRACLVGVDIIVVLITIIAGRVFPMFTRNATGVTSIRSHPGVERIALVLAPSLVAVDVISLAPWLSALVSGALGAVLVARVVHWGAQHSLREPLLWILHAGHAWLALGLIVRGAAVFIPGLPSSVSTHAITVGAIGSLTIGMMVRVSLGHTGRSIVASPTVCGVLVAIVLAAVLRVLAPFVAPPYYLAVLIGAGGLWSLAFGLLLWALLPIVASPRPNGKSG